MQTLQTDIKKLAQECGADICGFCDLEKSPLPQMPTFRYAVSIGVKLSDAVLKTIDNAPSFMYFQHYRAANTVLDGIAFRISRFLEQTGHNAFPVAASQS